MKTYVLLLVSLFLFLATGCTSDKEKLQALSIKADSVAKMTNDCHLMAQNLAPIHEDVTKIISELRSDLSEDERKEYVASFQPIFKTFFEIQTGSCSADPEIQKIFIEKEPH